MRLLPTDLPGLLVIEPRVFGDSRGFFQETYVQRRYAEAGIGPNFVQDNVSFSSRNTLRGLHYQDPQAQGKLVYVLCGEVFDVAVDIRLESPTFGQWYGTTLSADNHRQVYVPAGFAHGMCVISDSALLCYKCTDYYAPEMEHCIRWNDPDLDIRWPVGNPILSERDRHAPRLRDLIPQRASACVK